MFKISCNKNDYTSIVKEKFIFLKSIVTHYGDGSFSVQWVCLDKYCSCLSGEGHEIDAEKGVILASFVSLINHTDEESFFFVEKVDFDTTEDWVKLLNSCINRYNNGETRFDTLYLLWVLENCHWNYYCLADALSRYAQENTIFLLQIFQKCTRFLAYEKKLYIQKAFAELKLVYDIYNPDYITEIYDPNDLRTHVQYVFGESVEDVIQTNLFKIIDYFLSSPVSHTTIEKYSSNPLVKLNAWLFDSNSNFDYDMLESLYALVSVDTKISIIKRYFYDVHMKRTTFSSELITKFRDNKFFHLNVYRHCMFDAYSPMDLSAPLLCDCILNLVLSQGKIYQTFNGILDMAVSRCDILKPDINFNLQYFLPVCNQSAVYNSDFNGFIDYSIVCQLDETLMSDDQVLFHARRLLDRQFNRCTYMSCQFLDSPLSTENFESCTGKSKLFTCWPQKHQYENKWIVCEFLSLRNDMDWLTNVLSVDYDSLPQNKNGDTILDISQVSIEKFRVYIKNLAKDWMDETSGLLNFKSEDLKKAEADFVLSFCKKLYFKIYPLNDCLLGGYELNLLGLNEKYIDEHHIKIPDSCYNSYMIFQYLGERSLKEIDDLESVELKSRITQSLKQELPHAKYNEREGYFENSYDQIKLNELLKIYYFKQGGVRDKHTVTFLKSKVHKRYVQMCAPRISEVCHRATGLPFFWCRGHECFRNNLGRQTLDTCKHWYEYSLFHISEILGYKKIFKRDNQYYPDVIIESFISHIGKAVGKFNRLKCRSCGHLLFSNRSADHNNFNYFACKNPSCEEYQKEVYLNYCFYCLKELIDSRESVKCINGSYICPTCHSCCDDALFEKLVQKSIMEKHAVSPFILKMLGHGHNNHNEFFCHICGKPLNIDPRTFEGTYTCNYCHNSYFVSGIKKIKRYK